MMKRDASKPTIIVLFVSVLLASLPLTSNARTFRGFALIGPPDATSSVTDEVTCVEPPQKLQPIPDAYIEEMVAEFFKAWEEKNLDTLLAPQFADRQRLQDVMLDTVPLNTEIRVLAIQSKFQFAERQCIEMLPDGEGFNRDIIVTVTVPTQLEFEYQDARQTITGTNVYNFRVREEYR